MRETETPLRVTADGGNALRSWASSEDIKCNCIWVSYLFLNQADTKDEGGADRDRCVQFLAATTW